MPYQSALPTWLQVNNMNSPYQSGQGDSQTGFPYNAGGLNLGDYFDLTSEEAANASFTTNGLLFSGRYRYVQVDSGATAANVKTGTVGYIRQGSTVTSAVTINPGTGLTNGSYQVAATAGSGGGSGAILGINVAGGVIVGNPFVISGGFGHIAPPTFSLTALGGSGAVVVAQLNTAPNIVTSADIALATSPAGVGAVRPVVFLNSITPSNYGFIQELGVATVLSAAGVAQTVNTYATATNAGSSPIGLMTTSSATFGVYSIGNVIDPLTTATTAITPFKVLLDGPVVQD